MSFSYDQQMDREADPAFRNRYVESRLDARAIVNADAQHQAERVSTSEREIVEWDAANTADPFE